MIETLLLSLDNLGPFAQGVLGSAAFAIAVTIGRLVLRGVRDSSNTFLRFMSRDLVLKHIIHKKFVNSPRVFHALWGNFFVITYALWWFIGAAAILVTIFGIESLLDQQWLRLAGSYFALNALIEAHSWLKDRSDEMFIAHLDPEIKADLLDKFLAKEAQGEETSLQDEHML